jgi:hypothetical protein
MEAFRVVPGADQESGRGVRADAEPGEQLGCGDLEERFDALVELGDLVFETEVPQN